MTSNEPGEGRAAKADRRQWGRFVAELGEILVRPRGGSPRAGRLLDESFGGIGLAVEPPIDIEVGAAVDVIYDGVRLEGVVRNIGLDRPHGQRLGIQWTGHLPLGAGEAGEACVARGLLILFRMWEAGQSQDLARAAAALADEARAIGRPELAERAASLERAGSQAAVRAALEDLVDLCTSAA